MQDMNLAAAPPLTPKPAAGVAPDRLLSSNLAAIAACDLDLAKRVAQVKLEELPGGVTVQPSASGWPTVICGAVRIHSAHDPIAEAEVQARMVPADAPRAMALGFGAGYLPALLLQRPELRRLDLLPLSPHVLRAVAQTVDLKPMLCDPRLRFVTEPRTALVEPFAVVPPLLRLAEPAHVRVRDTALDSLALHGARERFWPRHGLLLRHLQEGPALLTADRGADELRGRHPGAVALLLAPGPGLPAQLPLLQRLGAARTQPLCLIALPRALRTLLSAGVVPHYVVTLHRPAPAVAGTATALVYTPLLDPEGLRAFPGPRYLAVPARTEGQAEPFLPDPAARDLLQSILRARPGSELFCAGYSLHLGAALARLVGAAALVLVGADLAYPEGLRAPEDAEPPVDLRPYQRQVPAVGGGQVRSGASLIACRKGLEEFLARHKDLPCYHSSPGGARIQGATEGPLHDLLIRLKVIHA